MREWPAVRSSSVEPRRTAAEKRFHETPVGGGDLLRQNFFSIGCVAHFEMRGAALFNADIENGLAGLAAHGFQMGLDYA